jgi:hypothetical protein
MSPLVRVPLGAAALLTWMSVAFGSGTDAFRRPADLGPPPIAEVALSGAPLYDGDLLAMPTQIAVVADRVVLVDGFAENPIHVIDGADGSHVASLGRSGEGPGEFEWPRAVEAAPGHDGAFWVFDAALSRLTLVEPERWATEPSSSRVTLPIQAPAQVTNMVRMEPDRLLAAGFFGDGRLGHFDGSGSYMGASGALPSSVVNAPPEVVQHAYRGILKPDPARRRLVLANRHAGFLEVFASDGHPTRRIEGPFPFEPTFEVRAGEKGPSFATGDDLRFGYLDVAPTADRIYALFSGRTRASHPERAVYGSTVHVFGWDGELQAVLRLDVDAMAIAVDENHGRLLAIRHLPTPAVVSFGLAGRAL